MTDDMITETVKILRRKGLSDNEILRKIWFSPSECDMYDRITSEVYPEKRRYTWI